MDDLISILRDMAAGRRNKVGDFWGIHHCAEAADALEEARAEREIISAEAVKYADKSGRLEARVYLLAEALRGLMLNSPGGHSCEEFHHYKSDRHMTGDDCPVQLRWNKAVTTAQAALRDHDQEHGNG